MNKIKLISLLAAAAVMTGSVAMAETYSATGNGYHGEMTVNVTIEDGKITDVELGDNHETNVVIDRAFPVIRERILEATTADVDSVTAATFSSYAIKTAVADAMQQAGLEAPKVAMQNAEKTATERAAESCDIVIVGGGPAGLAAAVSAKQTNADKNVILVEKLDILSGNGKFDMNFFDMINTEAQKEAGNEEWTVDQVAHFIESKAESGETAERIAIWGESAGAYLALMTALTPEVAELNGDVDDNLEYSSAVSALVDFYGPVEFYTMDAEYAALGREDTNFGTADSFESKFLGFPLGDDEAAAYKAYWGSYTDSLPDGFALKAWIQVGDADQNVPYTQSVNFAERLSGLLGEENVNFSIIEGAAHEDDLFYTADNLSAVLDFLDGAVNA